MKSLKIRHFPIWVSNCPISRISGHMSWQSGDTIGRTKATMVKRSFSRIPDTLLNRAIAV